MDCRVVYVAYFTAPITTAQTVQSLHGGIQAFPPDSLCHKSLNEALLRLRGDGPATPSTPNGSAPTDTG